MTHHENLAVVEAVFQGMMAGDLDAVGRHLADDAVVEWPQSGERIVGREACLNVYRNYPGQAPTYELRRISGGGDLFVVEAVGDYSGEKFYLTSVVDFRSGKIVKQTEYWASPFEAPRWRAQWVERMVPV